MNFSEKIYYNLLSQLKSLPYRVVRWSHRFNDYRLKPPRLVIDQLEASGFDSTSHMNQSLLAHCQGTYQLLKKWGNSESVCLAGLCHAMYGTDTFHTTLIALEERQDIATLIGTDAEKLVYYYAILKRNHFIGNLNSCPQFSIQSRIDDVTIPITALEFGQLSEIFLADRLEQFFSLHYRYRYQYKSFFGKARAFLSQQSFQEFSVAYNYRE